jgi:hypothetical protein
VRLKDVGREIWGPGSTASAALPNREDISKSTRQRVQGVADELGYQHDSIVRSLVPWRSNILGVVVPDLSRSFFSELLKGVDSIASEQGYSLLVRNTGEDAEKEDRILSMLESRRVDGLSIASHAVCESGIGSKPMRAWTGRLSLSIDVFLDFSLLEVTTKRLVFGRPRIWRNRGIAESPTSLGPDGFYGDWTKKRLSQSAQAALT